MKYYILLILLSISIHVQAGQNTSFWKNIDKDFDKLVYCAEICADEQDSLQEIVRQMYDQAFEKKNNVMLCRAVYWDAYLAKNTSLKRSEELADKAIALADTIQYRYDYQRILLQKCNILLNNGDYFNAYLLCTRLSTYFRQIGDRRCEAACHGNMGIIFIFLENYTEAFSYLQQAYDNFTQEKLIVPTLLARQQIAYLLEKQGKVKDAAMMLKTVIENFPDEADQEMRFYYYSSYARLANHIDEKKLYTQKAYEAALASQNWQCRMSAIKNKAGLYLAEERPDSAMYYINIICEETKKRKMKLGQTEEIYNLLSQLHAQQKEWQKAYFYLNLRNKYQDSIRGAQVIAEIQQEKIRKEIADHRFELKQSQLKVTQQQEITRIISTGLCLLLLLSGWIIYLLRKRADAEKRLREMEKREYNERLDTELQKVEIKNRELSSHTLLLVKKNIALRELKESIDSYKTRGQIEADAERQIKNKINEVLREENDWEAFRHHFEEVHPSFFTRLKEQYPTLTENELRLCAYWKINLGNKQIAQMLSVQPQTIIITRYRIRKKMNLPKELSLDDFLRNL